MCATRPLGTSLIVLEYGGMRRLLSREDDVEDRVQARAAGQRPPQISLGDAERVRRLASTVEDARNQALLPHSPRVGGASPVALADLEFHSFAGHIGGEV